jgi:methionyl-tRNA formyltransferase
MQKLKVAFFGTSDRSLPILEALNQNFSLMFTVTKEDSKVGRDQKTKETGVKTWSKEHGIKVIEVQKLTPEISSTIISQLIKDGVVFVVVADFSLMIPKEFLNRSDFRVINIHFSLLPTYRGASPVQFALLNGNQTTGVTFQFVEAKMDTGNIIQQIPYPIDIDDTTETLNNKLFVVAAKELPNVLANSLKETVQDESKATYTYSKTKPKTSCL